MKILFVGDACCDTGFSQCTHNVLNHWNSLGHEIHLLGINYTGDPHSYPYPIYPAYNPRQGGIDLLGWSRLPTLINSIEPDFVLFLNDPWNIPQYCNKIREAYRIPPDISLINLDPIPPLIGWLAIDGANQKGEDIKDLSLAITWTEFGKNELVNGGYQGPTNVIGLGVDTDIFKPQDKNESRSRWFTSDFPPDSFVIGVVGRNQMRKRLDLCIQYFYEWISRYQVEDAYLYLYCAPTGDGAIDIKQVSRYWKRYYGVDHDRIILNRPNVSDPANIHLMPSLYSSFDLLWTCSQGEGWWLPGFEAMACGIPVIAPRWSALGELLNNMSHTSLVPCSSTSLTSPGGGSYTIGGIASKEKSVYALDELYNNWKYHKEYWQEQKSNAVRFANDPKFNWKNIADKLLASILEHINDIIRLWTNRYSLGR